MKRVRFSRIIICCSIFLFLISCSRDDEHSDSTYSNDTSNEWIDQTMRYWYYWYSDIPAKKSLDFKADPEKFFYKLLSLKDGKDLPDGSGHYYYSSIKKKTTTTRTDSSSPVLGIHFQVWILSSSPLKYAINVLYVLPGSPAEEAGIKRGNWIFKIDNIAVNMNNAYNLFGTETLKLTFADSYDAEESAMKTVGLTPRLVEDRPILHSEIIQNENTGMNTVGYMVFNHFTSGPAGENDNTYNDELRSLFAQFKSADVNEFILDLRYNGGGLVTVAKLLAELLAPADAIGQTFCELQYNNQVNRAYSHEFETQANNLNLPRLFVLTSTQTASASEAIINCLRPYYTVNLIGEKTEGKNVGSIELSSDKFDYEIHPIVCCIYNSQGQSNYSQGFLPDWELKSNSRLLNGDVPFGDIDNDIAFNVALQWIKNGNVQGDAVTRQMDIDPILAPGQWNRRGESRLIVPLID